MINKEKVAGRIFRVPHEDVNYDRFNNGEQTLEKKMETVKFKGVGWVTMNDGLLCLFYACKSIGVHGWTIRQSINLESKFL